MPSAARLTAPDATLALHRKLLASASATAVLREVFGDPVEIRRVQGTAMPATPAQCASLAVAGPDEVLHRRVVLVAAGSAVSEADLWYVPARLWPGMAAALLASTIPFGTIVAPMRPSRETLAARLGEAGEACALEHTALLRDATAQPIALVHEYYAREAIERGVG